MSDSEPMTAAAIAAWIGARQAAADRFADVAEATEAHRVVHGCDAYAGGDGPLLAVLAAALRPARGLEIGTALGYSALSVAAGGGGTVDTVESDPVHAELARLQIASHGFGERIAVHVGIDLEVVDGLDGTFDLIFYDAAIPTPRHLDVFAARLAPAGTLVTSNLFLGQYEPDHPGLADGAAYRQRLFEPGWSTAFVGTKALSVRA